MPSKRTSDSVERILQDLNREQTAAAVTGSVTDQQVEDILRSVGLQDIPAQPAAPGSGGFAFAELENMGDLGDLAGLENMDTAQPWTAPPAPARAAQPAPRAAARPAAPAQVVPPQAPLQPQAAATIADTLGNTGTLGDTTRTGIIKGFLLKMAPEAAHADTTVLNEGKNQFQKFFKESVAVVPDASGRIREPAKKKRGLFGLKSAGDTDEFVPINVSLGSGPRQGEAPAPTPMETPELFAEPTLEPQAAQPLPEEPPMRPGAVELFAEPADSQEFFPDREPEPAPRSAAKKRGLLGGLFGSERPTEEIYIPEERAVPTPRRAERPAQPAPAPAQPTPEPEQEPEKQPARRSKYTQPAPQPAADSTLGGDTLEMLRGILNGQAPAPQPAPTPTKDVSATGTIYRKKRNTVEFVPGQKIKTKLPEPEPQPTPQPTATEPVGEVPEPQYDDDDEAARSGFTVQMGGLDVMPLDSTQDFLQAYKAVRPTAAPKAPPRTAPTPEPEAKSEPAAPAADPYADLLAGGLPNPGPYTSPYAGREPDEVDRLVDTITGRIRLDGTPAAQPADPTHSGFTQAIGGAPTAPAGPAHSGFTQAIGAEPGHSGFTQGLGAAPSAPGSTTSFVRGVEQAINAAAAQEQETAAQGDDVYAAAAQRLTASLADEEKQTGLFGRKKAGRPGQTSRPGKAGPRLRGTPVDETDAGAAPFDAGDTAELPVQAPGREYERAEDAPAVRQELEQRVLRRTALTALTGILAAALLGLSLFGTALPAPLSEASALVTVELVLLGVACALNWQTLLAGAIGLAGRPTPDTLALLPPVGAAVQLLVLLAMPGSYSLTTLPLLAGPAALVLCFNGIGKVLEACTVRDNFRLVSAKVDHAVAYRLRDPGVLRQITAGLAEPHACVLVSRPTQIFKSFLAASNARGTSDKNQQQFAWLLGGCSLAGLLFSLFTTQNAATAATVLGCILCLGAPLAGTLLSALPARQMQRSAAQVGAVIPGWRDIRQLGHINTLQVTARDLFPAGCVSLCGIKPVRPEHIDNAIVYAASVLAESGPTLRDIFLNMLGGDKTLLAKVDDRQELYGKGYVGWINKRRVLVGNRSLMLEYGVKIPDMVYEQQHSVNQRRVIYLAVSGKLFAMFQVAYQRDPDTAATLDSLRRTGLSLVVDCDDFNCDATLLETAYSLPTGSVKVLNAQEREALAPSTAWLPESEGNMLHLGSFASFVGGLEAAAGAAEAERKSGMMISASVLLSCVLGVLLTLTNGLATLPLAALILYQAAWAVLTLVFPLMQRY